MAYSYTKHVSAGNDYLQRVSKSTLEKAIAELIWNALDADASNISVQITEGEFGADKISIRDNGQGMTLLQADTAFANLGNSWKKNQNFTNKGRSLHGEKGEGRFKAFTLGKIVNWKTIYREEDEFLTYSISGRSDNLHEVEFSENEKSTEQVTGTIVEITELENSIAGANFSLLKDNLTVIFSSYLTTYPDVNIYILGEKINPSEVIESDTIIDIDYPDVEGKHKIRLIEWKDIIDKEKKVFLCKTNGAVLDAYDAGRKLRSLGYSCSAYISSPIIDTINSQESIALIDMNEQWVKLSSKIFESLNQYFKDKKNTENLKRVKRWIAEGIYPYEHEKEEGNIESIEQDIFNILATNIEENLPKFKQYDTTSKKFTFKLLSQALQDNPEAIQKIISEVLALDKKDQEILAELLEKTTLSSIIKSAKMVADRLNFLVGLEELLFDPENKKSLLERDQLHKILETESWVFGEHYHLTGSEQGLQKVLEKHISHLGNREDTDLNTNIAIDGKKNGRVDLMLHKKIEVREGEFDYLVVELKRPSQKINSEIMNQIEAYAVAVSEDERFVTDKCNWTFIAISNEFDRMAQNRANQDGSPKGRIYAKGNVKVFIMTWAEVISNAKVRLKLYREQLNYVADDESSRKYLEEIHSRYLPDTYN